MRRGEEYIESWREWEVDGDGSVGGPSIYLLFKKIKSNYSIFISSQIRPIMIVQNEKDTKKNPWKDRLSTIHPSSLQVLNT